ncbi:hypothetical protein BSAE_1788 [Bifidobacterium pullorum subsp. saeculare DSM 6531 = LMG 14934]|uniref:Uncharacterized protein n=1 Tax=Bifidobacterium pullorum subsp. saeculare DSM 6531 = LMG 14934 TaxID=1437611 RepID=A0A087CY01_9BIFI|nr:hypothetical protein BSAE_1788 [Bifidobacterium pullorum subsp. saeculare DSM 6531 = LMG 14934]
MALIIVDKLLLACDGRLSQGTMFRLLNIIESLTVKQCGHFRIQRCNLCAECGVL